MVLNLRQEIQDLHFLESGDGSRLVVVGDLKFNNSCWIQSKIVKEAWNGLYKYFEVTKILLASA